GRTKIYQLGIQGRFPKPIHPLGTRISRWSENEVQEWIAARFADERSERSTCPITRLAKALKRPPNGCAPAGKGAAARLTSASSRSRTRTATLPARLKQMDEQTESKRNPIEIIMLRWQADLSMRVDRIRLRAELIGVDEYEMAALEDEVAQF